MILRVIIISIILTAIKYNYQNYNSDSNNKNYDSENNDNIYNSDSNNIYNFNSYKI